MASAALPPGMHIDEAAWEVLALEPQEQPADALATVLLAMRALNAAAMANQAPQEALFLLSRSQKLGERLPAVFREHQQRTLARFEHAAVDAEECAVRGGKSAAGTWGIGVEALLEQSPAGRRCALELKFAELEMLRARSMTVTHMRDVATEAGDYGEAAKNAERAVLVDTALVQELDAFSAMAGELQAAGATPHDDVGPWGGSSPARQGVDGEGSCDVVESQLLSVGLEQKRLGPVHFAKSYMTWCVLLSKLKRHHDAAKKAHRAVVLLKSAAAAENTSGECASTTEAATAAGGEHRTKGSSRERTSGPTHAAGAASHAVQELLVGAMFNLATQIEQCGRASEAAMYYGDAADLARQHLGHHHHMTKQLLRITARGSNPATVPSRSAAAVVVGLTRAAPAAARAPAPPTAVRRPPDDGPAAGHGSRRQRPSSIAGARLPSLETALLQQRQQRQRPLTTSSESGGKSSGVATARPALMEGSRSTARPVAMLQPLEFDGAPHFPLPPSTARCSSSHGSRAASSAGSLGAVAGEAWPVTADAPQTGAVGGVTSDAPRLKGVVPPALRSFDLTAAVAEATAMQHTTTTSSPSPAASSPQQQQQRGTSATARGASRARTLSVEDELAVRAANHQRRFFEWMATATDALYADYARRDRSAAVVQRAWRSAQARLEAHNRRQVLYFFLHEEQKSAVACISAWYSVYASRRKLQRRLSALRNERGAQLEQERRRHEAALVLTKNLRIHLRRRNFDRQMMRQLQLVQERKLRQYETAAVVVQRWWPLIRVERAYWVRRNAEIAAQRRRELQWLEQQRAATDIQRVWRGRAGRRDALAVRRIREEEQQRLRRQIAASVDVIRIVLREFRARKRRLEREALQLQVVRLDAVAKIQNSWSACLRRRATAVVHQRARKLNRCAAVVQRCFRSHRARRELRVLRTIDRTTTMHRINQELREHRAAVTIQCAARVMFALRARRRALASAGRQMLIAARHLQRVGRGLAMRVEVREDQLLREQLVATAVASALRARHEHATCAQALARHRVSALLAARMRWEVAAEELLIERRARRELREDRAATQIQRLVRGHIGRRCASDYFDEVSAEKHFITASIIKIQSIFRVGLAKKRYAERRVERMRWQDKKREYEEVQDALFLDRVAELEELHHHLRRKIVDAEVAALLRLVSQHQGAPDTLPGAPLSISAVLVGSSLAAATTMHSHAPLSTATARSALNDGAQGESEGRWSDSPSSDEEGSLAASGVYDM